MGGCVAGSQGYHWVYFQSTGSQNDQCGCHKLFLENVMMQNAHKQNRTSRDRGKILGVGVSAGFQFCVIPLGFSF